MHPVHLQRVQDTSPMRKAALDVFWKWASLDMFRLGLDSGEQVWGYGQALVGILHNSPSFCIHAFGRRFYPNAFMSYQFLLSLGIEYMTLALPVACSTILVTGTHSYSLFLSLFNLILIYSLIANIIRFSSILLQSPLFYFIHSCSFSFSFVL